MTRADELDEVAVHTMLLTRGQCIALAELAKGMNKDGLMTVTHTTHGRVYAHRPDGSEYLVGTEQVTRLGSA